MRLADELYDTVGPGGRQTSRAYRFCGRLPFAALPGRRCATGSDACWFERVADAGQDRTAIAGATVYLDGTGSADADGDQLLFVWQRIEGEPHAGLEGVFSSRTRFNAPQVTVATVLAFRLIVVDGVWAAADEVRVAVRSAP
jgi:hypothetical protein